MCFPIPKTQKNGQTLPKIKKIQLQGMDASRIREIFGTDPSEKRKKMREMIFLYCSLLDGWKIEMLPDKTFKFTR